MSKFAPSSSRAPLSSSNGASSSAVSLTSPWAEISRPATAGSSKKPQRATALPRSSYTIAWVSALSVEQAAAYACIDEIHPTPPELQPVVDPNCYAYGRVGKHNVVFAVLPMGIYGSISTAALSAFMYSTFQNLKYIFLSGVAGGIPDYPKADVRLGDIVVAKGSIPAVPSPANPYRPAVINYDFGKMGPGGIFERTGITQNTSTTFTRILESIQKLPAQTLQKQLADITTVILKYDTSRFFIPKPETDRLYQASYEHPSAQEYDCRKCDASKVVPRAPRKTNDINIHYGTMASGNQVVKHAATRDFLRQQTGALCFEMEAAGLLHTGVDFLCVRGICDYSDSHKNKDWQPWAAAVAAAYTKVVLSQLP